MTAEGHTDDATLARYAAGHVDAVTADSVEQHLLDCARCRARIAGYVDIPLLEAVWSLVLERVGTRRAPLLGRLLRRLGFAEAEPTLVSAALPLLTSWLLGRLPLFVLIADTAPRGALRGRTWRLAGCRHTGRAPSPVATHPAAAQPARGSLRGRRHRVERRD